MQKNKEATDNQIISKKNVVIWFIVAALVVIAIGLWILADASKKASNTVVFKVGSENVYLDEVNFAILQNIELLGLTAESVQGETLEDTVQVNELYKQSIIKDVMDYKVKCLIAQQQGSSLTEEDKVNIQQDAINYLSSVDARVLNKWEVQQELVEEVYEQRYLAAKLEKSVIQDVSIEEQRYCTVYIMLFPKIVMEGSNAYAKQEDGVTPILLSDEDIEQRKADAEAALLELRDGADEEETAAAYGVAEYSAEESNLIDSFEEPFLGEIKKLSDGECSPVIDTASCYAIVKMISENDEETASQIMQYYQADFQQELLEEKQVEWYEQLGIGQKPELVGKVWDKISLYDYMERMEE